jgi:uncharacterized protein YukE
MPIGNSRLRVERTELENTGMLITSSASGMRETIAEAARRINALDVNWQGMANQQFMPEFNQSRTRASAVADGLTRLGCSLQEVGLTYDEADTVPIEFDLRIAQDAATGHVEMSYSFSDVEDGWESHAYQRFAGNEDGSVSIQSHIVDVSAEGQVQTSTQYLPQEDFHSGGYVPEEKGVLVQNGRVVRVPPGSLGPGEWSTDIPAPTGQQERLQERVADAMGGLPGDAPRQDLQERIGELDGQAGQILEQVKTDAAPTGARISGGGGGLQMPMQMPAMPPLQTPQSVSPQLLQSAVPPEGYGESGSLADQLMTLMAMDHLMDDSPLNRMGGSGGGGFSAEMPAGVGTMDLTDSMQTLAFPGQEVMGTAPELVVDPTQENALAAIEEEFYEHPREIAIGNLNPRRAEKE